MVLTNNKRSKRAQLICSTWLWAIGYIITMLFPSYWPLVGGRSLKGFTIGYLSGLMPSYINECFSETNSIIILAVYQAFQPLGVAIMALVGYLGCVANFGVFQIPQCWMIMMAITIPAPLLALFLRNSPVDFVLRGFNSQAYDVLRDMYRHDNTTLPANVTNKNSGSNDPRHIKSNNNNIQVIPIDVTNRFMLNYADCHAYNSQGIGNDLGKIFKCKTSRKRLFLAVFSQTSVQLSGINLISILQNF